MTKNKNNDDYFVFDDEDQRPEALPSPDRIQWLSDLKAVLSTDAGMRVFRRIKEFSRVDRDNYTRNADTHFLLGHVNMWHWLESEIKQTCPEKLPWIYYGQIMDRMKREGKL